MSILDSIIITSCMSLSGVQNDACQKAIQAWSKQSGYEQYANNYEQDKVNYLQTNARNLVGEERLNVVGGTIWIIKTAAERKFVLNLPTFGLCNSLSTEVNDQLVQVVFKWKF